MPQRSKSFAQSPARTRQAESRADGRSSKRKSSEYALDAALAEIDSTWTIELGAAEECAKQVLILAKSQRFPRIAAGATYRLACCDIKRGKYAQADVALRSALATARRLKDDALQERCWRALGSVKFWQNEFTDAVICFNASVRIAPIDKRALALAHAFINTGLIYERRLDWKGAHDLYDLARQIDGNIESVRPRILLNLGAMKARLGELKLGLRLVEQAVKTFRAAGERYFESHALSNAGFICAQLGDTSRGLTAIDEALEIARSSNTVEQQMNALAHRAQVLFNCNRLLEARESTEALMRLAVELRDRKFEFDAHELSAALAERDERWQDAAIHYRALFIANQTSSASNADNGLAAALAEFQHVTTELVLGKPALKRSSSTKAPEMVASRNELPLSGRQRQVLRFICNGQSNPAIAAALGISLATARFHVAELLAKLGATTRAQAAAIGTSRQLV